MKLLQRDLGLLLIGIIAVIAGLLVGNAKVAMLISLLVAIFSFMKKETGLLFLIIFIPVRPFLIAINPGYKILGDIILLLLLLRTVIDYRKDLKKLFAFHPLEWAFVAFGIIGILSAFITGVEVKSIIVQIRAYFLFYIVLYVVKRMDISNELIRKMSITTFVMALIMSVQGIVEKISNKTMLMPEEWQNWPLSPTNWIRVYGLIKGPNELSLFLVIAFIVSLYILKSISGKARILMYAGLTLIGTTILLTYSRGTLLTVIAFLAAYIVLTRKWRPFLPILIVLVVSVGMFFGINKASDTYYNKYLTPDTAEQNNNGTKTTDDENGADEGVSRYKNTFSDETIGQSSSSGRIFYVKKAIEIFKDHPIIGTGFGTFGGSATLAYSSPIYKHYDIQSNFYSDNQYILILAETGALGILAIFFVGYYLLVITLKNRKETFAPLLIYLLAAIMVGGAVYNILENDTFMLFYFMLLGIVIRRKLT